MIPDVGTDVKKKKKAFSMCQTAAELMPLHNEEHYRLPKVLTGVNAVITF